MSAEFAHSQSLDVSLPAFQCTQFAFAAHIRAPDLYEAPADVEARRMVIYRELFFNNVQNFISGGFPVLRSMIDDDEWNALVRDFIARHVSHSPYFTDISAAFVDYLAQEKDLELAPSWPFLIELAHYEWMELVALIAVASLPEPRQNSELNSVVLRLSPLAWPLAYNFAVHKIGPNSVPLQPEPTTLVIYRDRADHVHFMVLSGLTFLLLQAVDERHMTVDELAYHVQSLHPHLDVATLRRTMQPVVADFLEREILLPV